MQIRKAVRIKYYPNGLVDVYENYDQAPVTYTIETNITFDDLENMPQPGEVGISAEKIRDVKSLTRFLSENGKEFYDAFFKKVKVKVSAEKKAKEKVVEKKKKVIEQKKTEKKKKVIEQKKTTRKTRKNSRK